MPWLPQVLRQKTEFWLSRRKEGKRVQGEYTFSLLKCLIESEKYTSVMAVCHLREYSHDQNSIFWLFIRAARARSSIFSTVEGRGPRALARRAQVIQGYWHCHRPSPTIPKQSDEFLAVRRICRPAFALKWTRMSVPGGVSSPRRECLRD